MKYWSGGEYNDMIDISPVAEVHFVQNWPDTNLVIDEYSNGDQMGEETLNLIMERKIIVLLGSSCMDL